MQERAPQTFLCMDFCKKCKGMLSVRAKLRSSKVIIARHDASLPPPSLLSATVPHTNSHTALHHHHTHSLHQSSQADTMGSRENGDGGSSSGEGEKKKMMKRSRSASQEDDGGSSSKSSTHKNKKEEDEHGSRSDGGERYVCVQASFVCWWMVT